MLAWPMIRELMAIRDQLDSCLDDSTYLAGNPQPAEGVFSPSADVYEDHDNIIIVMEVPGIEADTVELELDGKRLRIVGKTLLEGPVDDKGRFLRLERSGGGFSRDIELPEVLVGDEPTGTLERGILVVHLPKKSSNEHHRIRREDS